MEKPRRVGKRGAPVLILLNGDALRRVELLLTNQRWRTSLANRRIRMLVNFNILVFAMKPCEDPFIPDKTSHIFAQQEYGDRCLLITMIIML